MAAQQELIDHPPGTGYAHRPVHLGCPSGAVCDQWIKAFVKVYKLIVARGSERPHAASGMDAKYIWLTPQQTKDGPRADHFPQDAKDALNPSNPDTLRTVVLVPYDTMKGRILKTEVTNDKTKINDPDKPVYVKSGEPGYDIKLADDEDAEGKRKKRYRTFSTGSWYDIFGKCIYDEAHRLRNATTQTHLGMRVLDAEINMLLTAIPMLNSAIDIVGQLRLQRQHGEKTPIESLSVEDMADLVE